MTSNIFVTCACTYTSCTNHLFSRIPSMNKFQQVSGDHIKIFHRHHFQYKQCLFTIIDPDRPKHFKIPTFFYLWQIAHSFRLQELSHTLINFYTYLLNCLDINSLTASESNHKTAVIVPVLSSIV